MKDLIAGYRKFRADVYPHRREEFAHLENGQSPRTLFITCSDSRIVPDLLLQTQPGELFICRNAGNIVPAHGDHNGGISATIEYAVRVLKVKDIVVCGHSSCGVMHGLLHPDQVAKLKNVTNWLSYGERARAVAEHSPGFDKLSDRDKTSELARQNVLAQVDNLRTHPSVAAHLSQRALTLHAWMFEIQTGEIQSFDLAAGKFIAIDAAYGEIQESARPAA